jgi:GNAT superfamily N-acetyltransferase
MPFEYQILTGDDARRSDDLLALCAVAFEQFSAAYLTERIGNIAEPCLVAARRTDASLAGFKLGYRRGAMLFYSWLGAVHPDCRRQGLGHEMTRRQHEWAAAHGYRFVETRTRAANRAMMILNLSAGFEVCGFEFDSFGRALVTQRKTL